MTELLAIPEKARQKLEETLSSTKRRLRSFITALESVEASEGPVAILKHQLEWSAIHLHAALQTLRAETAATESGRPRPGAGGGCRHAPAAKRGGANPVEGLHGRTRSVGIAEILGFLASLRKSGTLVIRGEQENFLIEMRDGAVVHAQGDDPPPGLRLGEILVSQGAIDQQTLDRFLERHPTDVATLGTALLDEGLIGRQALRIALAYQVQHVFHRLAAESEAVYQFEEDVHKIDSHDVRLNVQMLLLESARHKDERVAGQSV